MIKKIFFRGITKFFAALMIIISVITFIMAPRAINFVITYLGPSYINDINPL